jgi:preprotein translocase subunit YajC
MLGLLLQIGGGSAMTGNLVLIGGIIVIFYFFMIRPQQKKQKDQKTFLTDIKKGDMIVTMGGIHGKIAAIDDESVLLEIDKGTKIKIEKSSISLETSKKYTEKKK